MQQNVSIKRKSEQIITTMQSSFVSLTWLKNSLVQCVVLRETETWWWTRNPAYFKLKVETPYIIGSKLEHQCFNMKSYYFSCNQAGLLLLQRVRFSAYDTIYVCTRNLVKSYGLRNRKNLKGSSWSWYSRWYNGQTTFTTLITIKIYM